MDSSEARVYLAVIITVILMAVIIGAFAISIIRSQKRNLALQKAHALAEITAMEKERARIAADLHDDLGPLLSVIKFRVDHAEPAAGEEREELQKASQQLDEMIVRLRQVANNLMPTVLQRKGLEAALREFTDNVQRVSGLRISFQPHFGKAISQDKSVHIYRIVQELVHNCVKHAGASLLQIVLEENQGKLQIRAEDDGKGFDLQKTLGRDGIGMHSLRNRTELMGGRMAVDSQPGRGSRFIFQIPVL